MKPAVVLVLICAIVGFLLGSVDNLTLPTITANREARAWATYNALIPEATDFEALSCDCLLYTSGRTPAACAQALRRS